MVQRSKRKLEAKALIKKSQWLTKYLEVKKEPKARSYIVGPDFNPAYTKRINYNYIKKISLPNTLTISYSNALKSLLEYECS